MVTGSATRRSVLAAALTAAPITVPALATAGCGAPAAATPAAGSPSNVTILRAAIAAKNDLVGKYTAVLAAYPALEPLLGPLISDNDAHLAELQRRLIEPARPARRRGAGRPPPQAPSDPGAALATLRSAERAAAAAHVGQLRMAAPSLAQLLASIAACEAAHAVALSKRGLTP